MKIVGLTGGIGSGKSAATEIFESIGVDVVDTDKIAHQLTAPGGRANSFIGAAFGAEMLGNAGEMDRQKMRTVAFDNPVARRRLEEILHPLILEQSKIELAAVDGNKPYVVLTVPLLFERLTFRATLWRTVTIDCTQATQIQRVIMRPGLSIAGARKIIDAQVPRAVRLQLADDVIHNEAPIALLRRQIEALHSRYLACLSATAACA